ncbi:MAG: ribosome biogenesis/translation initiation ATPase RLI [Candidatus Micrarchaeota archaeon]|nr:ribosome biogenesis/translation initiation ATPase RLI [Candidatus Micrarchaeota archaeon]
MVTRVAVIDRDLCIREKCGYVCQHVCPPNRIGEECIIIEKDSNYPVIYEDVCIGCSLCVKKCPVDCISIINLAEEKKKQFPMYQYGINAFRLYGLPLPKGGAVSLVGKNGIGKTTAIKLLSKQLSPNFAILDHEPKESEITANLSLEERRYFSDIKSSIKVSHKPQHVDKLRDVFKGKVIDLLKKISKEKTDKAIELFAIQDILQRDVSQLSGGELQKIAVAVTYLKDADIYYFDEFTNYLDIEERLRVGIVIKDLSLLKNVVIAEHDLTLLDYVSDYVYLFYGDENVYGIVSGVKNVRAGINEYLEGMLKEENVRFRNHAIEFTKHSEGEIKSSPMLKYEGIKKTFDSFSFSSDSGDLRKGEIVGIVGKNALGKSLFVKILAGVEKPDKGESKIKLKVSYKPQYAHAEEVTVNEVFASQSLNIAILEECKRKLKISSLLEKKLTELSGGELQRVALSMAVSRDADVYLFDEPSAFLDVEQRFEFASLLRKVINESDKSAFVVDHDIVFMDAVANRLVVFDGKSSVKGHASSPYSKKEGMNAFLKMAGITMRRDKDSNRPRINKPGSSLDSEQKASGDYYYSS